MQAGVGGGLHASLAPLDIKLNLCNQLLDVPVKKRNRSQVTHTNTRHEQHHTRPNEEPPPSLNNDRRWRCDGAYHLTRRVKREPGSEKGLKLERADPIAAGREYSYEELHLEPSLTPLDVELNLCNQLLDVPVKRYTGHTHTHTDREQHPLHRHTHDKNNTPTPQTNTSHKHLTNDVGRIDVNREFQAELVLWL